MNSSHWTRRSFIQGGLATAAALAGAPARAAWTLPDYPIIDAHIHLFDPTRPQGVPWPSPEKAKRYGPVLPARYRAMAEPYGIRGAIETECSPWLEDNQWVLDVEEKDPFMVGTVGDLEPGKPGFARNLERFHRSPLFLGIRCGNLWGRPFEADSALPQFTADLKLLAEAGLTMDVVNPLPRTLEIVVRLSDAIPQLRMVLDHLPGMVVPPPGRAHQSEARSLALIAERPQIYVKMSEIVHAVDDRIVRDVASQRERLDFIYGTFGPDRVVFGSDWPNSDSVGDFATVMAVAKEFIGPKGREAEEKYFWKNSVSAYQWKQRKPGQGR